MTTNQEMLDVMEYTMLAMAMKDPEEFMQRPPLHQVEMVRKLIDLELKVEDFMKNQGMDPEAFEQIGPYLAENLMPMWLEQKESAAEEYQVQRRIYRILREINAPSDFRREWEKFLSGAKEQMERNKDACEQFSDHLSYISGHPAYKARQQ